jgi:transcription elongation factor GreA
VKKAPITARGAARLQEEVRTLKTEARPRVIKAIAEARGHGDLKENAEYHAAKEEQGFIEGRIRELELLAANVEVIDIDRLKGNPRIVFGATVEVLDDAGRQARYQIVGEYEADMKAGLISVTSPIARALIGKQAGDEVAVAVPGGEKIFEVVRVEYV